jgi:hypothetical protein
MTTLPIKENETPRNLNIIIPGMPITKANNEAQPFDSNIIFGCPRTLNASPRIKGTDPNRVTIAR